MHANASRRLIQVWTILTAVTILSWLIGRGHGGSYEVNPAVTAAVLVIAAVKALLVFQHFMEVRLGPAWLKRTIYAWAAGLPALLLLAYWTGL
jgi:Prokaryotic Cytochrome C oxidase subunit IV